jgi:hypothetical protein
MVRKFLFAFLVMLAACTPRATPQPTPSAGQVDAEEQAVYAALIQAMFPAKMAVLMNTTATDVGGNDKTDQTLQYVLKNMHAVSTQTIDSFKARNATAGPLHGDMQLGVPYALLSQDEITSIFNVNQDGWQVFYERYPDARGILTFSRVGFDAALDQALVYIGNQSQALAGSGHYVLLNKVNGVWTIDQKVMTWIS